MKFIVAGFIFNSNKLLLIHHKKLKRWLPIAGHVKENETFDEALLREIKEEVNLDVKILKSIKKNRNNLVNEKVLANPFLISFNEKDKDCTLNYLCVCETKNVFNLKINKKELNRFKWFSEEQIKISLQ